ncbi:MAG TPA: hypothetical protein VGA78_17770 [Gemmatimonadales bacterium]|jgi:hypothetical protein
MHSLIRRTATLALALAIPALLPAQTAPDLSGTWTLQVDKSDFGPMPAFTSRTDVIDHKEPKLTIKRTVVSQAGEVTSTLVYGVDGTPYKNTIGNNEATSTLKWDGSTLVIISTLTTPQGEVTVTDRISLSADGKTMTQARLINAGGQEIPQTMVLAKQ